MPEGRDHGVSAREMERSLGSVKKAEGSPKKTSLPPLDKHRGFRLGLEKNGVVGIYLMVFRISSANIKSIGVALSFSLAAIFCRSSLDLFWANLNLPAVPSTVKA